MSILIVHNLFSFVSLAVQKPMIPYYQKGHGSRDPYLFTSFLPLFFCTQAERVCRKADPFPIIVLVKLAQTPAPKRNSHSFGMAVPFKKRSQIFFGNIIGGNIRFCSFQSLMGFGDLVIEFQNGSLFFHLQIVLRNRHR